MKILSLFWMYWGMKMLWANDIVFNVGGVIFLILSLAMWIIPVKVYEGGGDSDER